MKWKIWQKMMIPGQMQKQEGSVSKTILFSAQYTREHSTIVRF